MIVYGIADNDKDIDELTERAEVSPLPSMLVIRLFSSRP